MYGPKQLPFPGCCGTFEVPNTIVGLQDRNIGSYCGPKAPKYRISMASVLGIVILVQGICLVFGYLDL